MSYYDTIEDDLQRAKAILATGKDAPGECDCTGGDQGDGLVALPHEPGCASLRPMTDGGAIDGADIYAAYKLLESFVAEIERLQQALIEAFYDPDPADPTPEDFSKTDWVGVIRDARRQIDRLKGQVTVLGETADKLLQQNVALEQCLQQGHEASKEFFATNPPTYTCVRCGMEFKRGEGLVLTPGQRMALTSIVGEYLRDPEHTEVFINASDGSETTPSELLAVLLGAR